MKALLMRRAGSLDDLYLGEVRAPAAGPGQLLVSVKSAGVNPADWKIIERGFEGWTFPKAVGLDAAGVVTEVGNDVTDFVPGDRVYYHGSFADLGAYAEQVVVASHVVAKLPDGIPFETAAAIPTAGFTAYQVIEERFRLGPDSVVLIHAGAGGTGGLAIQLAKLRDATVITTCSARNVEYVRGLGADLVVDYTREDLARRTREITAGRGVDAILDTVGGEAGVAAVAMLAFQGHLACCVGMPDLTRVQPLPRGVQLTDIALGWAYINGDRRAQVRLAHYGREMASLLARGAIDPMVEEVVEFDRVIEALRQSRSGRQRGKLVIRVS